MIPKHQFPYENTIGIHQFLSQSDFEFELIISDKKPAKRLELHNNQLLYKYKSITTCFGSEKVVQKLCYK